MRTINIIMYLFAATLTAAASAFEAHEWGTFTSLVGSDGRTQNGMYHEDEPLPSFVYKFGETRREPQQPPPPEDDCPPNRKICLNDATMAANVISQKMETPVIYFYLGKDEPQTHVSVNVRFPEGVVTESFPGPIATSPKPANGVILSNGNTTFDVDVMRVTDSPFTIPYVARDNIYSHARNVNSNIVRSGTEDEKFIFYRGLGRFQPRIQIFSENGSLSFRSTRTSEPQAIFLVSVNPQLETRGIRLNTNGDQVIAQQIRDLRNPADDSVSLDAAGLRTSLIQELIYAGLRRDEATAMLDTWEHGYLKVPGLRLLYILPDHEVDSILPVAMTPSPSSFNRAFVARIEVMLDTEERELLRRIDELQGRFQPHTLGRFAEPMLRRVREVAAVTTKLQPETVPLIDSLIRQVATGSQDGTGGVN